VQTLISKDKEWQQQQVNGTKIRMDRVDPQAKKTFVRLFPLLLIMDSGINRMEHHL
jgi:hypothetical protein